MGYILVPVGLLASNPWIVLFFVLVAIYCILVYFLDYLDNKFSLSHRGTSLITFWLLIIFVFFIIVVLFQTDAVIVLFLDILLIPVIFLVAVPPYRENADLRRNTMDMVRVLLGAVAVILVLFVSFSSTDGFGLLPGIGTGHTTGFEMQIVDSAGIPHKILGASDIQTSMLVSNNENSSIYLLFTEEGETAYQDAIVESGAAENPDEHPLSLVVDGETMGSTTLTREYAERVKIQRMRAVTIFIGSGTSGQDNATRILKSVE